MEIEKHPTSGLDADIHQRVRLGVLGLLHEVDEADFGFLLKSLSITDGNLSRNITMLEERGFVAVRKAFEGKRPRTWVKLTRQGKQAFEAEVEVLRAIVACADRNR